MHLRGVLISSAFCSTLASLSLQVTCVRGALVVVEGGAWRPCRQHRGWRGCENFSRGLLTVKKTVIRFRLSRPCLPNRVRRSEEHTSELQSQSNLVCRLLLEKKKKNKSMSL